MDDDILMQPHHDTRRVIVSQHPAYPVDVGEPYISTLGQGEGST
jgi:hypothetical protein